LTIITEQFFIIATQTGTHYTKNNKNNTMAFETILSALQGAAASAPVLGKSLKFDFGGSVIVIDGKGDANVSLYRRQRSRLRNQRIYGRFTRHDERFCEPNDGFHEWQN
jgi:hypothetical protein